MDPSQGKRLLGFGGEGRGGLRNELSSRKTNGLECGGPGRQVLNQLFQKGWLASDH